LKGQDTAGYFKCFHGSTLLLLQLVKFKIGINEMRVRKEHRVRKVLF